jgi:dipeptidyl aminopeptidase/acylaminoacyl peptidase
MRSCLKGVALGLAAAVACTSPELCVARPFTIDDLLHVESLGGAYLAPGGRWLVVGLTLPYDTAAAYDDDAFEPFALSRLDIADLTGDQAPRPLLPGPAGDGINPGPFSPDGQRMAVFRLQGHHWDLGIADLARRDVRWPGLTVDPGNWGRNVQWRSNNELVAIAVSDGEPARLNRVWASESRPPARWSLATAGNAATDTALGSGRFLTITPQGPAMALVAVDARTGGHRELIRGHFIDLEISPGGRFVVALAEAAARQPQADETLRPATADHRRTIALIDLASGAVARPCGQQEIDSHLLSWSPDGSRLLVFGRDSAKTWESGALLEVHAADGACAPISMPGQRPRISYDHFLGVPIVHADWMGEDPIVLSEPTAAGGSSRPDWWRLTADGPVNLTATQAAAPAALLAVDASGILFVENDGVWRIDAAGHARRLAAGFTHPAPDLHPGDGDRLAYVAARGPTAWVSDGAQLSLAGPDGMAHAWSIPAGDQALAVSRDLFVARSTDAHGVSALLAGRAGELHRLLEINRTYESISFPAPVAVPFTGARGETLDAWLYMPADLPANTKAPLVVIPYPGSVYAEPPRVYAPGGPFPQENLDVLTAAGYAVLVPSMPRDWSSHEPAAGLADQVLAAVDAAAKIAPIDRARLALWGHSWGGYAALAIATQTGRFKSVIESAGKSDLISAYGPFIPASRVAPEDGTSPIDTMGWMEHGQGNLGVAPGEDIDLYARNSPVFHADHISAPVLMIHGDLDFVPLAQGEEMFSALYRQDKDAVLVTLWGEGHNATSPANIRKTYAWMLWWLGATLGPGAPSTSGPAAPAPRPSFDGDQTRDVSDQVAP